MTSHATAARPQIALEFRSRDADDLRVRSHLHRVWCVACRLGPALGMCVLAPSVGLGLLAAQFE